MKIKLLTKRQQLGIFNCSDPIALMREYVSFSEDIMSAAKYKDVCRSCKLDPGNQSMLQRLEKMQLNERQEKCLENLSSADVTEIYDNSGHIYPEVFLKMLEVFPEEISKEILLEYVKYCNINNDVKIKALEVLGKEAKDVILPNLHLTIDLFNQILRTFSRQGAKEILIAMSKGHECEIEDEEVERKILRVFSDEDLKDIFRAFIDGLPWMSEDYFLKIFEICSKEEAKELIEKAIGNDLDLWFPTLKKIVEYFPKDEAKKLIDAFWETSPGSNCYTSERREIERLLSRKQ